MNSEFLYYIIAACGRLAAGSCMECGSQKENYENGTNILGYHLVHRTTQKRMAIAMHLSVLLVLLSYLNCILLADKKGQ